MQNEKPRNLAAKAKAEARPTQTGTTAVLHTTYGDIHIRLFPDAAPKAVENFVTHARSGYYNNTIFHRVIKKFMIQVGRLSASAEFWQRMRIGQRIFSTNIGRPLSSVRRSPGRWNRRRKHLGQRVRGRVFDAEAGQAVHGVYGQRRAQHQRLSILHHDGEGSAWFSSLSRSILAWTAPPSSFFDGVFEN